MAVNFDTERHYSSQRSLVYSNQSFKSLTLEHFFLFHSFFCDGLKRDNVGTITELGPWIHLQLVSFGSWVVRSTGTTLSGTGSFSRREFPPHVTIDGLGRSVLFNDV